MSQHFKRRDILKTIGAGAVGGIVLTGSAVAADTTITLKNFRFNPTKASVSLGSSGTIVEWVNKEKLGPHQVPHDVHLFDSKGGTRLARSSEDDTTEDGDPSEDLWYEDSYKVKFWEDTAGKLVIEEIEDDSNALKPPANNENIQANTTERITWDGSVTLHMHCSHHKPGMSGSLKITR